MMPLFDCNFRVIRRLQQEDYAEITDSQEVTHSGFLYV